MELCISEIHAFLYEYIMSKMPRLKWKNNINEKVYKVLLQVKIPSVKTNQQTPTHRPPNPKQSSPEQFRHYPYQKTESPIHQPRYPKS